MRSIFIFVACILMSGVAHAKSYIVQPTRVIDGDTFEIADTSFGLKLVVRVNNVDTPEKGSRAKCDRENELAFKASTFTTNKILAAKKIEIKNLKWDKYGGRILADVFVDRKLLAEELIGNGLAREYRGEKKASWCY